MGNVNPKFKCGRGDDSPKRTLPEGIFDSSTVVWLKAASIWLDMLGKVCLHGNPLSTLPRVSEDYETAGVRFIYQASQ